MGQQQPGGLPELETVPGHVEEQDVLFEVKVAGLQGGGYVPGKWTEHEIGLLGERVRDYLRRVARRAVEAFTAGGLGRGDAKLYVSEDLQQIARETWTPPKAGARQGPAPGGGGRA